MVTWVLFIFLGSGAGIQAVIDIQNEADFRMLAAAVSQYRTACFVDKKERI